MGVCYTGSLSDSLPTGHHTITIFTGAVHLQENDCESLYIYPSSYILEVASKPKIT